MGTLNEIDTDLHKTFYNHIKSNTEFKKYIVHLLKIYINIFSQMKNI